MIELIGDLSVDKLKLAFETEILEYKEANNSFKVRDLGIYFSALSNEANLRGAPYALLIFGVNDDGEVVGTSFCQEPDFPQARSKGLQRLKKSVAEQTNNRITFREIHEISLEGKRVVVFEIPPATRGIPTQWAGAAWAREGESLAPLPLSKIDEIRAQPPEEWAKAIVPDVTVSALDADAVARLRFVMRARYGTRAALIDALDDAELLDKAGITIRGRITNAALVLLGSWESCQLIEGPVPRITWTLYEQGGHQRAYEHFGPPFLMTLDGVLAKIRNERYRLLEDPASPVPREVTEYDAWTLRELLGNALAHQDYAAGRRINVNEFPDRVSVANVGPFIPGSLERALSTGYKPAYYRNPFLCDAMLSMGLLDQNALGIRTMCENALARCMPLPSYTFGDGDTVEATVLNHEIDPAYTAILSVNPDMPMQTLLALDKLQKGEGLSTEQRKDLLGRGFAVEVTEGLKLHAPSGGVPYLAKAVSSKDLGDAILRELAQGPTTRVALAEALAPAFNRGGDFGERVYRALRKLEQAGAVTGKGSTRARIWELSAADETAQA